MQRDVQLVKLLGDYEFSVYDYDLSSEYRMTYSCFFSSFHRRSC